LVVLYTCKVTYDRVILSVPLPNVKAFGALNISGALAAMDRVTRPFPHTPWNRQDCVASMMPVVAEAHVYNVISFVAVAGGFP